MPDDDSTPEPDGTAGGDDEARRLEILRALERGEITVAEATEQLANIDEVPR